MWNLSRRLTQRSASAWVRRRQWSGLAAAGGRRQARQTALCGAAKSAGRAQLHSSERRRSAAGDTGAAALRTILDDKTRALVAKEKAVLSELCAQLQRADYAGAADVQLLDDVLARLNELFMLVVVGEFNSGKSSFINTLLGKTYLREGVTPTTAEINLLRYADHFHEVPSNHNQDVKNVYIPQPWLTDISLVDTPGTNAIIRSHERITQDFVPRSDMILFVTSCDRAFSESERQFLSLIGEWKKKVVVVLSKYDLLENDEALDQVTAFVSKSMNEYLDMDPKIFPVSARRAHKAKREIRTKLFPSNTDDDVDLTQNEEAKELLANNPDWQESRFGDLQSYILEQLDARERTRLKLLSPIGVAQRILTRHRETLERRKLALSRDSDALQEIETRLSAFRSAMLRDVKGHMAPIEGAVMQLGVRAQKFIDSELSLTNTFSLLSAGTVQKKFQEKVVNGAAADVEKGIDSLSDWLMERGASEWNAVTDIARRAAASRSDDAVQPRKGAFEYSRHDLLHTLSSTAHESLANYDRDIRTENVAMQFRNAILSTVAVEIGAAGFASLFATSLFDVTMILPSTMAVAALAIVPYQRRQLKLEAEQQIEKLRSDLNTALWTHCNNRVESNIADIEHVIAPYSEFVKTESKNVVSGSELIDSNTQKLASLEQEIEQTLKKQ